MALSAVLFVAMVVCFEGGYRVGRRSSAQSEIAHRGIGPVEAGVFGLAGLLLAFSFAAGLSDLDMRRRLIVEEANAIELAYSRIDLLAAADQAEMRTLFRQYLDGRLAAYQRLPNFAAFEQESARVSELEQKIWSAALKAIQAPIQPAAPGLVLPAINTMFHVARSRKVALYTHVPVLIFALLMSIALLSALIAGYTMAQRGSRSWLHMIVYSVVISITIYTIFDLDHPRGGFIRIDAADAALIEVRNSMP